MRTPLSCALTLTAGLVISSPLAALQHLAIVCPSTWGPECTAPALQPGAHQRQEIVIHVVDGATPVAGATVIARASSGVVFPDTVFTGADGVARLVWFRDGGGGAATIAVAAQSGNRSAVRQVVLPVAQVEPVPLFIVAVPPAKRSGFQDGPLPGDLDFVIRRRNPDGTSSPLSDPVACAKQQVRFSHPPGAGDLGPGTSAAAVFPFEDFTDDGRTECFAWTNWMLKGPGTYRLYATLIPAEGYRLTGSPAFVDTRVRALPRLVAGLAYSRRKELQVLKPGVNTTIRVQRLLPDGSQVSFDSTVTTRGAAVDTVHRSVRGSMVAAVSAAVPLPFLGGADRLSITAGVGLADPREEWFVGVSLLRLLSNMERFPLDLHLIMHWTRDRVLSDPVQCAAGGDCGERHRVHNHGLGGLVTADLSSLVTELIKRFTP